jgi:membrane protein
VGNLLPGFDFLWQLLNFILSFVVITLLFGMIYKVLPNVKIVWSDVWIGAAITSLLFTIGKFILGVYLGNGGFGSAYGAASSLVVLLAWVYYSAQILFFGAEFTKVYAKRYGSRIVPSDDAIPLTTEARAQQGIKSSRNNQTRSLNGEPAAPNLINRLLRNPKSKRSQPRNHRRP